MLVALPLRRAEEREPQSLTEEVTMILREARMVLPGVQTLFGFQMIAVFNQRFEALPGNLQWLHFGALWLCALAMALVMTPAAYHRLAQRGYLTRHFAELATRCIAGAMVALACSLSADVFVITHLLQGTRLALLSAPALLLLFLGLWIVWPLAARRNRTPAAC